MTRTQAWRKVAEAFGTLSEDRTPEERKLTSCGLCWAIYSLTSDSTIYDQTARLGTLMKAPLFWWPYSTTGDAERALFAGLMAAMTQQERDELEPGL